jgi:hypothetical protein
LHVLVPLHRLRAVDPTDERAQEAFRVGSQAYWLLNGGWELAGLLHEGTVADLPAFLAGGLQERTRWGERVLAGLRRSDLSPGFPASLAASMFQALPLRLGLSAKQRCVAELGLWRLDDDEIARQLGLSAATVRRHWRDICDRMERVLPEVAEDGLGAPADESVRGRGRRRHMLDYLMHHIHELRPPPARPPRVRRAASISAPPSISTETAGSGTGAVQPPGQ